VLKAEPHDGTVENSLVAGLLLHQFNESLTIASLRFVLDAINEISKVTFNIGSAAAMTNKPRVIANGVRYNSYDRSGDTLHLPCSIEIEPDPFIF
jgi:hypothetical protein